MFTANPDIEVLVALYDEMALGGLQALKAILSIGVVPIPTWQRSPT